MDAQPWRKSGLLRAGEILLVVGAVFSAILALLLVWFALWGNWPELLVPGVLAAVSAGLGLRTRLLIREGDIRPAARSGFAAALLGLQVLSLLGAILVMVAPEAEPTWHPGMQPVP